MHIAWNKIYIAEYSVDMRKGFDALYSEAQHHGVNIWCNEAIIFVGRGKRLIKILSADKTGMVLFCKKFSNDAAKTRLQFLDDKQVRSVTRADLAMLWEGIDYEVKRVPVGWQPSVSANYAGSTYVNL